MTAPAPRIALTLGDPAGVGPELVAKTVAALAPRVAAGELELVVVGSRETYEQEARALGLELRAGDGAFGGPVSDIGVPHSPVTPGEISAAAGHAAYEAVRAAVRLAMANRVDAICTAPLSKEALNLAGHRFSGHTELLAALTGAADSVMMLAHGAMRVSHVSTHVALSEAASRLTPHRLRRVITLTHEALQWLGVRSPRIAVAALNPHGGERGLFGREDDEVTTPTLAGLRGLGMHVEGPHPGDTIFVKLRAGQFDAVVAMYHDQGHIPVKLLGFHVDPASGAWDSLSGVNITLGLPITRTSVDHGTAFDIAGKGIASARSMIEAVETAVTLSRNRPCRLAD